MTTIRFFISFAVLVATVTTGSPTHGQGGACFFDRTNVGCDPEGYGYPATTCPSNCTQADVGNTQCTDSNGTSDSFNIKNIFFDTMTRRIRDDGSPPKLPSDGPSFHENTNVVWSFNVCLRQGGCLCDPQLDPTGGPNGYNCVEHGEWQWEDWFPILTNVECQFNVASDPCNCLGDPLCELLCSYGGS
jgi:hypothetical protein